MERILADLAAVEKMERTVRGGGASAASWSRGLKCRSQRRAGHAAPLRRPGRGCTGSSPRFYTKTKYLQQRKFCFLDKLHTRNTRAQGTPGGVGALLWRGSPGRALGRGEGTLCTGPAPRAERQVPGRGAWCQGGPRAGTSSQRLLAVCTGQSLAWKKLLCCEETAECRESSTRLCGLRWIPHRAVELHRQPLDRALPPATGNEMIQGPLQPKPFCEFMSP